MTVEKIVRLAELLAFAVLGACGVVNSDCTDAAVDGNAADSAADATTDATDAEVASDGDAASDVVTSAAPHLHVTCAASFGTDSGGGPMCDASTPTCCTTLAFNTSMDRCLLDRVTSVCTTDPCPTSVQPFCGGNEQVRQCDYNADCTEPSNPVCCTYYFDSTFNGQTGLRICTSQFAASSADASCGP